MMRLHAYLWRAAGFGATPSQLQRSLRQGYEASVRELVRYAPETPPPPRLTTLPPGFTLTLAQVAVLITWWLNQMVHTRSPLQEKMTLFWHGHFTTAVVPVVFPAFLANQNDFLRKNATGRFSDLLLGISRDPAMLIFLDGHTNKREHPNENYARELLELFTLGEGHYTEADVKAAARAFTGWGIDWGRGTFRFSPEHHDDGPKRFLGHTGQLGGEEVVKILARHPRTARYLVERLFRFFTGVPAPPQEIERLSGVYQQHHGVLAPVLEALFLGQAFRATAEPRQAYKSPVEFTVGALRSLNGQFRNGPGWQWLERLIAMGQLPWLPPSVAGWAEGKAWLNTGTLLDRVNFARQLAQAHQSQLASLVEGATAEQALDRLLAAAGLSDVTDSTRAHLARACRQKAPADTLALILASPDFQVR